METLPAVEVLCHTLNEKVHSETLKTAMKRKVQIVVQGAVKQMSTGAHFGMVATVKMADLVKITVASPGIRDLEEVVPHAYVMVVVQTEMVGVPVQKVGVADSDLEMES